MSAELGPLGHELEYNRLVFFEILGEFTDVETIAVGPAIRELKRLQKQHGRAKWRKMKGISEIRLQGGRVVQAELHWYEAHGIGKKEFKVKRLLD